MATKDFDKIGFVFYYSILKEGSMDEAGDAEGSEGEVVAENGTAIAAAKGVEYAVGKSNRSLNCQYTDMGSAQTFLW
jgi:hypothetical protein